VAAPGALATAAPGALGMAAVRHPAAHGGLAAAPPAGHPVAPENQAGSADGGVGVWPWPLVAFLTCMEVWPRPTAVGGLAAAPVATACQPCQLRQPATARKRQRISQTRQGR